MAIIFGIYNFKQMRQYKCMKPKEAVLPHMYNAVFKSPFHHSEATNTVSHFRIDAEVSNFIKCDLKCKSWFSFLSIPVMLVLQVCGVHWWVRRSGKE